MNKQFPVSTDHMHHMLEFVRDNVIAAGISKPIIGKIELAVEEALTNIISYSGLTSDSSVTITCIPISSGVRITLEDEGMPFDPLCKANKIIDPTISLENRELGGFGIHLILNLMDKVEYHREGNRNILMITKWR
jgi:serine/threonine-protein kinase RsbW